MKIKSTFARYLFAGLTTFLIEYLSFILFFYQFNFQENISHSLSFCLALIVNYLLLSSFVFLTDKELYSGGKYLLLIAFNFVASNLLITLFSQWFAAYIAKFAVICVIVTWNYLIMKKLIFIKADKIK